MSIAFSRYTSYWQEDRAVAAGGRAQARFAGGGKSELRRAVCRITSGTWASKPMDGQCHRKYTAGCVCYYIRRTGPKGVSLDGQSSGKGEMVR